MVNQSSRRGRSIRCPVVDNPQYAAFGHGTMTIGFGRLVVPGAVLMRLKAFRADGTATLPTFRGRELILTAQRLPDSAAPVSRAA
jgi:hypothetical protein